MAQCLEPCTFGRAKLLHAMIAPEYAQHANAKAVTTTLINAYCNALVSRYFHQNQAPDKIKAASSVEHTVQ